MALSIKNDEADALARELVGVTGESLTTAVTEALRERLARERRGRPADLIARIEAIQDRVAKLPVYDGRSPDEIIGYNEHGHFD